MRLPAPLLLVSTQLVVAACSSAPPPDLGERMFDHFQRAGQIQTALIVGDLEAARRPAAWLANYDQFDGLDGDADWVDRVRSAAGEIESAATIAAAASAVSRMAGACAGCHESAADGPRFRQASDPPAGGTAIDHMMRHLWGMDRMWEGLISGSTETWTTGAAVLADEQPSAVFSSAAGVGEIGDRLHRQATAARSAAAPERPSAYADLLGTCAACHERVGVGPG